MSLIADLTASVNAVRPGRTRMRNFDMPLAIAASTLLLLGLLMVYSASIALADGPRYASYGRYYFVIRHGLFVSAGLVGAAVVLSIPIRAVDATLARAHALLAVMESELAQRDFLAGSEPTIADVACYAYVAHAPEGNVSLADYPRIRAWLSRIENLPRFVPMESSPVGLLAA